VTEAALSCSRKRRTTAARANSLRISGVSLCSFCRNVVPNSTVCAHFSTFHVFHVAVSNVQCWPHSVARSCNADNPPELLKIVVAASLVTGRRYIRRRFFMRPVGAMIIGAYADRVGRRAAMTRTCWMMALGTAALGLCPSFASIGVIAPLVVSAARSSGLCRRRRHRELAIPRPQPGMWRRRVR
jgi:hypothetical protein